jgi:hypothetical protein
MAAALHRTGRTRARLASPRADARRVPQPPCEPHAGRRGEVGSIIGEIRKKETASQHPQNAAVGRGSGEGKRKEQCCLKRKEDEIERGTT